MARKAKIKKDEFADIKYGDFTSDVQCTNPWEIKIAEPKIDPELFKKQNPIETSLKDINNTLYKNGLDSKNALNDLLYIFKDIFAGDKTALERPEFQCLNFAAVKKALDWLSQSDSLNDSMRSDLLVNCWRLNYRSKPPTPKEFLTEKYIGGMAVTLHNYIKEGFCDFLNPLKPYRTGIFTSAIGTGKSTLSMLITLYIALMYSYMWSPWKFFGGSPSTIYTFVLCSWTQKKGSELLAEPIIQILEQSPFYHRLRTHEELIKYSQSTDTINNLVWTTSAPSSVLSMQNGGNFKVLSEPHGLLGQAQPLTEPIKLYNNKWTTMGKIKVGDKIASPTQKFIIVEKIIPQGVQNVYKIILNNNKFTKCNLNHLWCISYGNDENYKPIFKIVTTEFILKHKELEFFIPNKIACKKFYKQILNAENDFIKNLPIKKPISKITDKNFIKINTVIYCGKEEQQCIYVQSPDHLYITNNDIITHNCIILGVMTELGFFREQGGWSDEKILKLFTKTRQRIDSRMKGSYMGRALIDSSPNTLESPIDKWIWEDAPKDKKNYIVRGSWWKLFPENYPEFFDKEGNEIHDFIHGFPLYKGSGSSQPQVLKTEEQVSQYVPQDIVWCPVKQITSSGTLNFLNSANENPIEFMRDWAGIPAGQADRIFSDHQLIEQSFNNNLKNHFSSIIAPKEEEPEHLIWNKVKHIFFNKIIDKYYFYYEPEIPRVASIDLAISGDTASIALSHVERDEARTDSEGNPLRLYITDMTINVIPKGSIINLDAFKFFILDLKRLGNLNINHVSFDGFQSSPIMQSLERNGIKVDLLSVDKNNAPYLTFIDLVFHRRWYCGKNIFVKNNMLSLQMAVRKRTGTKKIDHMNGDNVYTDSYCGVDSIYTDNAWKFSSCGKNAKDSTDCIAANISLLDTYANEYIETHVFKPFDKIEKTYENTKSSMTEFLNKMGLKISI